VTEPAGLQAVREALESAEVELQNAELTMRPTTTVDLDEDGVGKVLRLIEALEDQDDVNAVHANFEADADVLERVAAA
jgi:transcriptional/translational regulatory protein YebC/TACO1